MTDPVRLVERLRDAIEAGRLEGLGELCIDGEGVVIRWRGGSAPPELERLIAGSDTPVEVHPCRYTDRELGDVVQRLVDDWDRMPFTMVTVGRLPATAGVRVGVAEPELAHAREHFEAHPLRLPNGSPVHLRLVPTGYPPLVTYPLHPRPVEELEQIDVDRYLGLHVDEATIRALGDGWMVRSYGEGADGLTLELRPNRVDLRHDRSGVVIWVGVG